jgi:hypothetical protein
METMILPVRIRWEKNGVGGSRGAAGKEMSDL